MNYLIYVIVNILIWNGSCIAQNFEKVEAVLGQIAELPCNVTAENEDDKLTIMAWYKGNATTAFYSRDLRGDGDPTTTSMDTRFWLVTADNDGLIQLQIHNVTRQDGGFYQCFADFAASPAHKTFVKLEVIEPPTHLWVVFENSTQVAKASVGVNTSRNIGPYYVGDAVQLACVALGGKPQASLSWWSEQRMIKNSFTRLSEVRVRSDLQFGPLRREDHGRVFTCFAINNEKVPPLSIDITVDMYLPPNLVTVRSDDSGSNGSMGRVRSGETLALQCRVLGARPLPPITWKLGGNQLINLEQKITKEPSQRLVVSEVQLSVDREYDEAQITCCAPAQRRDADAQMCAPPLPLTVLYPPLLEIVGNENVENNTLAVLKGSSLNLACNHQANPAVYELYWFHKDIFITNNTTSNPDNPIQQMLQLTDISERDAGQYYCVASNVEGSTCSEPVNIDVIYPAYCEEKEIIEYGLGENELIEINCTVIANPRPTSYRWVIVNEAMNVTTLPDHPHSTEETEDASLTYRRPNGTTFSTIFCWGQNDVPAKYLPHTPCAFLITDETIPRPPTNCQAVRDTGGDILISCDKGYNGGLDQRFKFIVKCTDSDENLVSIINVEPNFMIQEPKSDDYKFIIIAFNDKGESNSVEIDKESIIDEELVPAAAGNMVQNITTLALALCGGVALVALAACGLVLCSHERAARLDLPRGRSDPPLCAYNTEESNCETCQDSDDGSECNVRRTESFRRALSRQPSKNFDVRRTSSFHSARYIHDAVDHDNIKCGDIPRHSHHCRVHSLQNINRKRDMDALCDHLVLHLPPETNYHVPRPMNTFHTMPRKMRHKLANELSDENSEMTQNSDGFSLPPPPDEFNTYRAGARIKDMPTKSIPTYSAVKRKTSAGKDPGKQQQRDNVTLSPMNTVGLPTISGGHSVYSYPDDDPHGQVNTNPFDEDSS